MALTKATKSIISADVILPSGAIVMWSGTIANIPAKHYLCDGANGTPDLRDKFLIGAQADSGGSAQTTITGSSTKTGGSKDAVMVSHSHTASSTDSGHTHQLGPFGTWHGTDGAAHSVPTWSSGDSYDYTLAASSAVTNSGASNISTTVSSAGSSGTNANLPPYYVLAFIMKS